MTHSHDFPTLARMLNASTLAVIVEFHDPDNGVLIGDEIVLPTPNKRQGRLKSARVKGSFAVGPRVDDDGVCIVPITIEGATWAVQQQNYLDLYAAIDSVDEFYLETVLSGVTTRWYSDAAVDVLPAPIDSAARVLNSLDYELRFLVQPNPSVTIGA